MRPMQVLQAGAFSYIYLELDPELITKIAEQAGFECEVLDGPRAMVLELSAPAREGPLLLFDAAEPANLGWFSRCQFYADGKTGAVLQTPFVLANMRDRSGRVLPSALRLQILKELPSEFRMPGRQQVNEQLVYSALAALLMGLTQSGVAICGGPVLKPLAGRVESSGSKR
jgi:hypothetical protein